MPDHRRKRTIHLGAYFPGINTTTVWADPAAGSQIAFDSFTHFARTAERGLFDFLFLAEGLRMKEHRGRIYELDIAGRPDNFTVLNALAAVTTRLGLVGSINTTFNEPFEIAKQFASLDHLSGGRAGWNIVTTSDAQTGANFRRGGYLPHDQRYRRAAETVEAARRLWDTWAPNTPVVDRASGVFVPDRDIRSVQFTGDHVHLDGCFPVPRSPQGRPALVQAGDSLEGREFGAATADAVFTMHGSLEQGRKFYGDIKSRMAQYNRDPADLKVLPAAHFVLGDSAAAAAERAAHIRTQQVGPQTAIAMLEEVWGRDLSDCDPDGPVPPIDDSDTPTRRDRQSMDRLLRRNAWWAQAQQNDLSIRELVIEKTSYQRFVGTPTHVAEEIIRYVDAGACDGFIMVPHINPTGLDEFVDKVIPELQDRGQFRTQYAGKTLIEHLHE